MINIDPSVKLEESLLYHEKSGGLAQERLGFFFNSVFCSFEQHIFFEMYLCCMSTDEIHISRYVQKKLQAKKKFLLRERKRHTARRVASVRYAVLSPDAFLSPVLGVPRGTPPSGPGMGYPHPDLRWVLPPLSRPGMGDPPFPPPPSAGRGTTLPPRRGVD